MTNGDMIRSLCDEQLAKLLMRFPLVMCVVKEI